MQTAVVRTATGYLVGLLATLLASANIEVSDEFNGDLTLVVSFLVGTLYYVIVKALEKKWPKIGWLLGSPNAPVYPTRSDVEAAKAIAVAASTLTPEVVEPEEGDPVEDEIETTD